MLPPAKERLGSPQATPYQVRLPSKPIPPPDPYKVLTGKSYYAVANGRERGIFQDFPRYIQAVEGFRGAISAKFKTLNEARKYLKEQNVAGLF